MRSPFLECHGVALREDATTRGLKLMTVFQTKIHIRALVVVNTQPGLRTVIIYGPVILLSRAFITVSRSVENEVELHTEKQHELMLTMTALVVLKLVPRKLHLLIPGVSKLLMMKNAL